LVSLGPVGQRQVLAQLEANMARNQQRGIRSDPDLIAAVRELRTALAPARTEPQATVKRQTRSGRTWHDRGIDIGDLYEPATYALATATGLTVQIIEPVEVVNRVSGRSGYLIDVVEARWTVLVANACTLAAIEPVDGPVDIWIHQLRERGGRRQLADVDAGHFAVKGGVDGLVRAGVIVDDGPDHVWHQQVVAWRWSNVTGIIFEIVPASPHRAVPVLTVPNR
jgi:hypothetical protein